MQFRKFAPLVKVNEATREIDVLVTSEVTDLAKEKLDWETTRPFIVEYSESVRKATEDLGVETSLGNVRVMHTEKIGGKFTRVALDDVEKQWTGTIKVKDGEPWDDVLAGHVTGVSIGGDYVKRWDDPVETGVKRYTAKIHEVSLVDRPCNKEATFLAVRKDGSSEMRKFAPREVTQTWDCGNDGCETKHIRKDDARRCLGTAGSFGKAADVTTDAETASEKADGYSYKAPSKQNAATYHRGAQQAHSEAADAHRSAEEEAKSDGRNKDARKHGEEADRHEEHAAAHGAIAAAHEAAKAAEGTMKKAEAGTSKYGDVKFADEDNKKYPIDTEEHIRAAWNYINKKKNAAKYSAEDLKTVKGKIVAAWKKEIDKEGPPSAEKGTANVTLNKCLDCVARLAYATQTIDAIADGTHCDICDASCTCGPRCQGVKCGCCWACTMQIGAELPLTDETIAQVEDASRTLFNALVSAAEDVRDADAEEDDEEDLIDEALDAAKTLTAMSSTLLKNASITKMSNSLRVRKGNGSTVTKKKEAPMKKSEVTKDKAAEASEKANDFAMEAPEGSDAVKYHADAKSAHETAAEAHRGVAESAKEGGNEEDAKYHNRVADKHEQSAALHGVKGTPTKAADGALLKAISEVGDNVKKMAETQTDRDTKFAQMEKAVETLTKTVAYLAGQPAEAPGALRTTAVAKSADVTTETEKPAEKSTTTTSTKVPYSSNGVAESIEVAKSIIGRGMTHIASPVGAQQ